MRIEPNNHNRSGRIRFAGYEVMGVKKPVARIYKPGYGQEEVKLLVAQPGHELEDVEIQREGDYWKSVRKDIPLGSQYQWRILDKKDNQWKTELDLLEVRDTGGDKVNVVAENEDQAPQISTILSDIFPDSVQTNQRLEEIKQENDGFFPWRDHFRQFGGNEAGMLELLPTLQKAGFTGVLLKPSIGRDNISSNKYWTQNNYALNNTFASKPAFRNFMTQTLRRGMKVWFDGAFVNQGLNGVQYMANLAYGFQSPYWHWFKWSKEPAPAGKISYPSHAYEKMTLGVLPTKLDDKGDKVINYDAFDVEFKDVNKKLPFVYIELHDPRKNPQLFNSEDSVQSYRFPVPRKEAEEVQKKLAKGGLSDIERKQLMTDWKRFRLGTASEDNSGIKWNGQIDVAEMNMANPEVRQNLKGAIAYWSRMVMNTQTATVTRALSRIQGYYINKPPLQWIDAITQNNPEDIHNSLKILPKVIFPEIENLTPDEVKEVYDSVRPDATPVEQRFARTLLEEYPIAALELPDHFQAVLHMPDLPDRLSGKKTGLWTRIVKGALKPFFVIPELEKTGERLLKLLTPGSFQDNLQEKLAESIKYLNPQLQQNLKYPLLQSLLTDSIGEALLTKLFTNQELDATDKQREEGFYETVDTPILQADPKTAAGMVPRFLRKRLNALDPQWLARQIEEHLTGLEPRAAALAQAVLQKREYGLNWRIDAAKDVGPITKVQDADASEKPKAFDEAMEFVYDFWKDLCGAMRAPFPKASIIAELTDFELLGGNDMALKWYRKLFSPGLFTSTPNMRYLYSPLPQISHYAPRPDEFGDSQMGPNSFLNDTIQGGKLVPGKVKAMSQAVPFPALRQFQNMSSSHDFSNTSHVALVHPQIYTMDHTPWWGLQDDLRESMNELFGNNIKGKACFNEQLEQLAAVGLSGDKLTEVLKTLKDVANDVNALPPDLRTYYSEWFKKGEPQDGKPTKPVNMEPTPRKYKRDFIANLCSRLPQDKVSPAQQRQLQSILTDRVMEASEAKAIRAVLNNTLENFNWKALGIADNPDLQATIKEDFYQALNKAIKAEFPPPEGQGLANDYGRHFGARPLEITLDFIGKQLGNPEWLKQVDLEEFKEEIYMQAAKPVLPKVLRMFAIQMALPGNASIHLPDLFVQFGGEWLKNIFVQDRNIIRVDKLKNDRDYQAFFREVSRILNSRAHSSALNNGAVLEIPVKDEEGILPIIRDNGKDQAIVLTNTGKPSQHVWDKHNKIVGTRSRYASIYTTQPIKHNFKLDLSSLKLSPGTLYKDIHTQESFAIDESGRLVKATLDKAGKLISTDSSQGMDIEVCRVLKRV